MKNNIFIISVIVISLFSCSNNDLDRTIFIPDEKDSNLPAYTEWGYNSFGAKYDRTHFISSQKIVPCKIIYKNDTLKFSLNGVVIRDNNRPDMTLEFSFPSNAMTKYSDLAHLNNITIDLASNNCGVKIFQDNTEKTLDILTGTLHFKRTQLLYVDEKENRLIISGVFNVQFLEKGYPTSISDGRFDMGIDEKVFWAY